MNLTDHPGHERSRANHDQSVAGLGVLVAVLAGLGCRAQPLTHLTDDAGLSGCVEGCVDGLCTLACGQATPMSLAVRDGSVYWGRSDSSSSLVLSLVRVPVTGGAPTTLASRMGVTGSPLDLHTAIAPSDSDVFWELVSDGQVLSVPLDGGVPVTIASDLTDPVAIALGTTAVYWTSLNADGGVIESAPLGGGAPATFAGSLNAPAAIAVDAAHVYWGDFGDNAIVASAIDGGTPTTLATGQDSPFPLVVDPSAVFWATHHPFDVSWCCSSVMTVTLAGGSAVSLAGTGGFVTGLAVDNGGELYWTTTPGLVVRFTLATGTAVTLATSPTGANDVAIDESSVYWTEEDRIMRLTPR